MPDNMENGVVLRLTGSIAPACASSKGGDGVDAVCCEDDRGAVAVMAVAGVGDAGHLATATAATAAGAVATTAAPGVAVIAR